MKFIYKQIYNWVKRNLSDIGNKLADVLPGMIERQIVRVIINTLLPKHLDTNDDKSSFYFLKKFFILTNDLWHC